MSSISGIPQIQRPTLSGLTSIKADSFTLGNVSISANSIAGIDNINFSSFSVSSSAIFNCPVSVYGNLIVSKSIINPDLSNANSTIFSRLSNISNANTEIFNQLSSLTSANTRITALESANVNANIRITTLENKTQNISSISGLTTHTGNLIVTGNVITNNITPSTISSTLNLNTSGALIYNGTDFRFNGSTTTRIINNTTALQCVNQGNTVIYGDGTNKRVGICQIPPSYTLDVNGDCNLRGNLLINGVVQTFGGSSGTSNIQALEQANVALNYKTWYLSTNILSGSIANTIISSNLIVQGTNSNLVITHNNYGGTNLSNCFTITTQTGLQPSLLLLQPNVTIGNARNYYNGTQPYGNSTLLVEGLLRTTDNVNVMGNGISITNANSFIQFEGGNVFGTCGTINFLPTTNANRAQANIVFTNSSLSTTAHNLNSMCANLSNTPYIIHYNNQQMMRIDSIASPNITLSANVVSSLNLFSNGNIIMPNASRGVGIGTTYPQSPLFVNCNSGYFGFNNSPYYNGITVQQSTNRANANCTVCLWHTNQLGSATLNIQGNNCATSMGIDNTDQRFKMTLTNDFSGRSILTIPTTSTTAGFVGIGTTTPTANLHVQGDQILSGSIGVGTASATANVHIENAKVFKDANKNTLLNPSQAHILCYNSNSSNSEAHATICLRTNGGSGGNPCLSMDINGVQGWSIFQDNSDSDCLKIKAGWDMPTSSTYDCLKIDTSRRFYIYGEPSIRCRFHCSMATGSVSIGATTNVQYTGTLQDISGTASISSGILTLPSTYAGYYTISFTGRVSDTSAVQGCYFFAGATNLMGSSDGIYFIPADPNSRRVYSFTRTLYLSASTQIRSQFYASTTIDIARCEVVYHGIQS